MKTSKPKIVLFLLLLVALRLPQSLSQGQQSEIDTLLGKMTLEQKVGQMFMVNLYGPQLTFAGRDLLQQWQPGAVVLLDSNIGTPEAITRLTNSYQQTITEAGGVPLFIAADQEGGIIQRLRDGFTIWPAPMLYSAIDDPELVHRAGQALAAELRAVGVNMNLAPVADLDTNINNPIIGRRSAGSDPEIVSEMLGVYIQGMQSGGVLATLKHFPGHGDTTADSHIDLPELPLTLERLNALELIPFQGGVRANAGAIMTGHLWMSAFDPQPVPASLSHAIVTVLLREGQGYDGIIITDALDMDAIDTRYSPEDAAVAAVLAGNDMILIGAHVGEQTQARAMQAVVDAVREGRISEGQIDESVARILSAKANLNILDWSPLDPVTTYERIHTEHNSALIQELFEAGITVAFDNQRLRSRIPESRISLIYPGSRPRIAQQCNLKEEIQFLAVSDAPEDTEINLARTLGSTVDINIVFTSNAIDNEAQQQLVNALPPERTIVIALASPYDLLGFPDISTLMLTYSPIDPAPQIACEIIFGLLEAQGRLPITLSESD